jgi:molybdopterin-guanine dinucleotide biosynthesis protein A
VTHPALPESGSGWGGCILAGGQGSRMGGHDKGLVNFRGYPLIVHVARRVAPQVAHLVISANRNIETYTALGYPVLPDALPGFLGPLAGMHAALHVLHGQHDAVLFVPCDSPYVPLELALRLGRALGSQRAAIVTIGGEPEPAFAMLRTDQADMLKAYLVRGERKLAGFFQEIGAVPVPFDDVSDGFINVNTPEELALAEARAEVPR